MDDVIRKHIEIVEGAGGPKARIVGSRIRVVDIVEWHERQRMSPFEIVHEFPTITIADVYAALAYYWDNRGDIEVKMAQDERFAEEYMRQNPSQLQEKLARQRATT
jgi:uncharacterized protein (DUF433 family)